MQCVFFTLNRSFYPSASVRKQSRQCNAMSYVIILAAYDRHDIHKTATVRSKGNNR